MRSGKLTAGAFLADVGIRRAETVECFGVPIVTFATRSFIVTILAIPRAVLASLRVFVEESSSKAVDAVTFRAYLEGLLAEGARTGIIAGNAVFTARFALLLMEVLSGRALVAAVWVAIGMSSEASLARCASFLVTACVTVEGTVFTLVVCFVEESTGLACCARITSIAFSAERTALSACFRLGVKETALLTRDALAVYIKFESFRAFVADFATVTLFAIYNA